MAEAVCKSQKVVIAAETMVIPRSLSCAIQSVTVVPSSTDPCLYVFPVSKRTLSVVVVLPASIWAIMPIFRIFSKGTTRSLVTVITMAAFFLVTSAGILILSYTKGLPPEVGEGAIGFGDFFYVVALFNRRSLPV